MMKIAALLFYSSVFARVRKFTDLDCSNKIAIASMAALSDVDYQELKVDFYGCPALTDHIREMDARQ